MIRKILFVVLPVLIVVCIVCVIRGFHFGGKTDIAKTGAVIFGDSGDGGWNESHFTGISEACKAHESELIVRDHVPEDEQSLRTAVSELAGEGCGVIFLTSFGYGDYADDVAREYPDVTFCCISGGNEEQNCVSYFARIYQARYLSGIVAGTASETGVLGFVGAMPISEVNRSINAYAMGARLANPDAKVLVYFTGSWDDEAKEREAVSFLAERGADVITYHEDKPYAVEEAEKLGLYSVGYEGVYEEYTDRFLTAAVVNWNMVYEKVLSDYLSGRIDPSRDYWIGLPDEAVSLYPYSPLVPDAAKTLVDRESDRIRSLTDVFSGKIYDNTGVLRCDENERIGDEELFNGIDWYGEGVEVYGQD